MIGYIEEPPYEIDLQGLPWPFVGLEFDVAWIFGKFVMTITELDIQAGEGLAESGSAAIYLVKMKNGKWGHDGVIFNKKILENEKIFP